MRIIFLVALIILLFNACDSGKIDRAFKGFKFRKDGLLVSLESIESNWVGGKTNQTLKIYQNQELKFDTTFSEDLFCIIDSVGSGIVKLRYLSFYKSDSSKTVYKDDKLEVQYSGYEASHSTFNKTDSCLNVIANTSNLIFYTRDSEPLSVPKWRVSIGSFYEVEAFLIQSGEIQSRTFKVDSTTREYILRSLVE